MQRGPAGPSLMGMPSFSYTYQGGSDSSSEAPRRTGFKFDAASMSSSTRDSGDYTSTSKGKTSSGTESESSESEEGSSGTSDEDVPLAAVAKVAKSVSSGTTGSSRNGGGSSVEETSSDDSSDSGEIPLGALGFKPKQPLPNHMQPMMMNPSVNMNPYSSMSGNTAQPYAMTLWHLQCINREYQLWQRL